MVFPAKKVNPFQKLIRTNGFVEGGGCRVSPGSPNSRETDVARPGAVPRMDIDFVAKNNNFDHDLYHFGVKINKISFEN